MKLDKQLILKTAPFILAGYFGTKLSLAYRLAEGEEFGLKLINSLGTLDVAFENPLPSFHPQDLFIGVILGLLFKLVVYLRGKNKKKFRNGIEYGSARWGDKKDIEPYVDKDFQQNVILTETESLMMSGRPPNPKYARNKNILVIGGSGSGKTRFWVKPNLLQMHSSYIVTDPKGARPDRA